MNHGQLMWDWPTQIELHIFFSPMHNNCLGHVLTNTKSFATTSKPKSRPSKEKATCEQHHSITWFNSRLSHVSTLAWIHVVLACCNLPDLWINITAALCPSCTIASLHMKWYYGSTQPHTTYHLMQQYVPVSICPSCPCVHAICIYAHVHVHKPARHVIISSPLCPCHTCHLPLGYVHHTHLLHL